jgi:hypothetical protein
MRLPCTGERQHHDSIKDYGFDLGGPIVKDKLWFYGTYGKQDIKNCRFAGTFDDTLLPSYNAKINWQANFEHHGLRLLLPWQQAEVRPRRPGPAPKPTACSGTRTTPSEDGGLPGGLSKLEVNHTFSPNFFMSAKAAYYDTGFGLFARGGADKTLHHRLHRPARRSVPTSTTSRSVPRPP